MNRHCALMLISLESLSEPEWREEVIMKQKSVEDCVAERLKTMLYKPKRMYAELQEMTQ